MVPPAASRELDLCRHGLPVPRLLVQQTGAHHCDGAHGVALRALFRSRSGSFAAAAATGAPTLRPALHSLSRASQVGSFLHLGALMNLDFGKVLKEGDALAGSMSASTEQLPGLFAKIPNFTAAVVFFIALWNSWCERCHPQAPAPAHSTAASALLTRACPPPLPGTCSPTTWYASCPTTLQPPYTSSFSLS